VDPLGLLETCGQRIREAVLPLLGTKEAQEVFGRGAGGDPLKKIDLEAERALLTALKEEDVSCTIVSEESGLIKLGATPENLYVVVDPVDGTTNALRGIPFAVTSIAIAKKPNLKHVEAGLVLDLIHNQKYFAQKGRGAFKEHERIKPSTVKTLEKAMVGLDFNTYRVKELAQKLTRVLEKTKHVRHFGANALEVCYVADGTSEAFIDLRGKLRVTDVAAAYLILREAGGIMTTPKGEEMDVPLNLEERVSFIAAGNTDIYKEIRELLT